MSCCEGTSQGVERYPGTGCCGTSCAAGKAGCSASEPRIRSCCCQENVGCIDRVDCGGFRPSGTAATGACPGPCQCVEEETWNSNVPPKPNCEWLSNFSELRRQWSDHGRQNSCKCCNCKPCRTAAPCRPCLTPPPICSPVNFSPNDYQACCSQRLSGGACGEQTAKPRCSSSHQRDRVSASGSQPSNCCCPISSSCPPTPSPNMHGCSPPPCCSPSECSIRNPWPPCRPPSSCQPCSPSSKAVPQKRSCCQCVTSCCMCQPMPRTCNCPPPVQVDARAERECSCDCPSSPECACPPSERRFPRSKVKCPNARLCCPTPRPQPGPKCKCVKCQPCLPPPCDPCTSSKCRTSVPKVKPCYGDSACDESAPCRPSTPQPCTPCRPTPPCTDCRKTPPPCRPPAPPCCPNETSGTRPGSARLIRLLNRPRSPNSLRPTAHSAKYSSPGQSRNRVDLRHNNNDEREKLSAADEGFGDDDGEADPGCRGEQCHCGPPGSRGCDDQCDFCCSLGCDGKQVIDDIDDATDNHRCNTGSAIGRAEDCDYCCFVGCDEANASQENNAQCCCGSDRKTCAESCDHCCSQNCDSETLDWRDKETNCPNDAKDNNKRCMGGSGCGIKPRAVLRSTESSPFSKKPILSDSLSKCGSRCLNWPLASTPEVPHLETLSRFSSNCVTNVQQNDESRSEALGKDEIDIEACSKVTGDSTCKLLRSLILAKSPMKYLHR